jgi:hypothetical protein
MKNLILIFLLFLASCSVHKNITSSHVKTDSSIVTHKDSSFVSRDTAQYKYYEAKGVDVEFDYSNGDVKHVDSASYHYNAPTNDPFAALVKDAVANGNHSQLISIKFHADSISEKSGSSVTLDSGHVSQATQAHVKTNVQTASKVVSKTGGIPWYIYVVGGLALVLFVGFKFLKWSIKL